MAIIHIKTNYFVLNDLFYFRLLYALDISIPIKPIKYIMSLIFYYFNPNEISVIIAIIDIIVRTPSQCCSEISLPLAFITYRGTSLKPTN